MTNLKLQKRLASKVANVGKSRIVIDPSYSKDIKESITKADVRALLREGKITIKGKRGVSRHRARLRHLKHKKGRQRGYSKRQGTATARTPRKRAWINKVRSLRRTLRGVKLNLKPGTYQEIYRKIKGNFFRSNKHLRLYLNQNNLVRKK